MRCQQTTVRYQRSMTTRFSHRQVAQLCWEAPFLATSTFGRLNVYARIEHRDTFLTHDAENWHQTVTTGKGQKPCLKDVWVRWRRSQTPMNGLHTAEVGGSSPLAPTTKVLVRRLNGGGG